MAINTYLLVQEKLAELQKSFESAQGFLNDVFGNDGMVAMVETKLYVGLNDAETKKQILETEQYMEQLKKLCFTYHTPFSIDVEEGGYFHDNGDYVEEKTLVLTLIDVEIETILKIAKDLCTMFHQEAVLMTEDDISGCYIRGDVKENTAKEVLTGGR